MIRWLRRLAESDIPESVDRRVLLRAARAALVIDVVLALGNIATRWLLGANADLDVYDAFLAWNLPGHGVVVAMLLSILRSSGELRAVAGRLRIMLAAAAWTAVVANWMIGGFSVTLNLALSVVLVCAVRLFLGARLGIWCLLSVIAADLLGAALRIGGVFPDHSAIPDYVLDDSVRALGSVGWRSIVLGAMYVLTGYVARRSHAAENALRLRNVELEQRLRAQGSHLDDVSPAHAATMPSPPVATATQTSPIASDDHTLPARQAAATAQLPAQPLGIGSRVGRYELLAHLGSGAMGVVYEARDTELDRRVAIKLVSPRSGDLETARARLRREAQAMARLSHPNVAAVFDIGTFGDQLFIAMELVRGQTLRAHVGTDRPWREVLPLLVSAARGLAAAHEAGVIHRDFKPDNVLVRDDGVVRVSDFGLAREASAGERDGTTTDSGDVSLELVTATGAIVGTPAYLAPESATGVADAATDQFAFAVTCYEVLEGRRPFEGADVVAMLRGQSGTLSLRPWRRRDLPSSLMTAIERALAVEPSARWPTMAALSDELVRVGAPRRVRPSLVALLFVGLAASATALWMTRSPTPQPPTRPPAEDVAIRPWVEEQLTVKSDVFNAFMAPDGRTAATIGGEGILLFSTEPGTKPRVLYTAAQWGLNRSETPSSLVWSPDSRSIVLAGRGGQGIRHVVVDIGTGAARDLVSPRQIQALLDNNRVITAAAGGRTIQFESLDDNTKTATVSCSIPGDYQWLGSIQIARQMAYVTIRWADRTAALAATDFTCTAVKVVVPRGRVESFYVDERARIFAFAQSPSGGSLVEYGTDDRPRSPPRALPTDTTLVGVRADGAAVLLRRTVLSSILEVEGDNVAPLMWNSSWVQKLRPSPDGAWWAAIGKSRGQTKGLFVMSDLSADIPATPLVDSIGDIAWSPDGTRLAVSTPDPMQLLTMLPDGRERRAYPVSDMSALGQLTWLDDHRIAYLRSDHRTYRWLDLTDGRTGELLDPSLGWTFSLQASHVDGALALYWNRHDPGMWLVPSSGKAHRIRETQVNFAWSRDGQLWFGEGESVYRYDPRTDDIVLVRKLSLYTFSAITDIIPVAADHFFAHVSQGSSDLVLYGPRSAP